MKTFFNMRMMGWLQIALALTIITFLFNPGQVIVSLYKLSLVATAGCGGYWLDRSIFPYARPDRFYPADDDPDIEGDALNFSIDTHIHNDLLFAVAQMRRAVIVAGSMVAVAIGA